VYKRQELFCKPETTLMDVNTDNKSVRHFKSSSDLLNTLQKINFSAIFLSFIKQTKIVK